MESIAEEKATSRKRTDSPPRHYRDDPLLIEAMQALANTPGRRWLRERGGFDVGHMDVRITTARAYSGLVAAVESACAPRPEV
jgi:hypothetical protein